MYYIGIESISYTSIVETSSTKYKSDNIDIQQYKCVCYYNYLKMMFELECFFALGTFELAQHRTFVVAYHVPLETVYVSKCFVAYFA